MGWLYETIEVKIEKVLILGKDISYTQLFCFVLWQMAFGIKRSGRSRSLFVWLDPYLPNWKLHSCYHTVLAKETSEKAMATHSRTLAWKIPWMAEPYKLQSMGSLRVGLNNFTFTFMHRRRKWQPTPVFLPGESQGRGSLVGCRLWGRTVRHWRKLAATAAAKET